VTGINAELFEFHVIKVNDLGDELVVPYETAQILLEGFQFSQMLFLNLDLLFQLCPLDIQNSLPR